GVVVSVPVSVGQKVAAGEVLMVIEAMKMEHTITAPYAGTVGMIHFARGERVPEASELLEVARAPANVPENYVCVGVPLGRAAVCTWAISRSVLARISAKFLPIAPYSPLTAMVGTASMRYLSAS